MSPSRLELDQAIEELRSERPSSDRRRRSLEAVLQPRRRALRLPGAVAIGVAAMAFVLMVPHRRSGLAWADALRRTQQARNVHVTYVDAEEHVIGESWSSGAMWALWLKDKSGRLVCENRSDDRHFYYYIYRATLTEPNATQYGTLWNQSKRKVQRTTTGPAQTIEQLLSTANLKVVGQREAESYGKVIQRYELKGHTKYTQTVDVDPSSGRILFVHTADNETAKLDYPDRIDPKVFSFKSRVGRDVAILDLRGKEDPSKIPPYMPAPIASQGAIRLREVSISPRGDLYIYWTGYLPHKSAAKRLKVIGAKTGEDGWIGYYQDGFHPVRGPLDKRLIVYRVSLPEKIGNRLSVRIPTASSYVEFKDVAVKRPEPLRE